MKGIFVHKNSPYYWLRYYDPTIKEPANRRRWINTKIPVTSADRRRYERKRKGENLKYTGTRELKELLKRFRAGLAEKNIEQKAKIRVKKKLLFSEGTKEFLFYKPNIKAATVDMYNYAATQMIAACTDKHINRYTKKDYTLLIRYCKEKNYSTATTSTITRHLSPLWNYFVKNRYASENIIIKLKSPKGNPQPIKEKDLRVILKYYKEKGQPKQENTVLFLLFTGLRPSSAVMQDWEWIDLENEIMTSYNVKSSRFFIFPIYNELKELLLKIGPRKTGLVLGYKSTDSLKFFNRDMHKLYLANLISRKYSLYSLRDTFASYLANNNLDVSNVQELLNHSNIRITREHYVKMSSSYLKKKINSVNFKEIIRQRDLYEQIEDDIEEMKK